MAELAGVSVGNYFLLECLGREGMIDRYRARPTTRGGFDVVLRLFRPPFPDPTAFKEHFPTEVEKVWHCHHEHIQPLIEFGAGKDLLFDVTEFPKDRTLEQILEQRDDGNQFRTLSRIADLITQVCTALDYAHEQNIVHGNIQLSSLLIQPDQKVLLTNFGMKRMYVDGDPLVAQIQEGNARFVAPEQVVGILTPASDIYAVGVLLFRLLTGHFPYEGESAGEIALKHANEAIPSLQQLRPDLSEAVELVVRVALAKSPEARFPNANALASAFLAAIVSDSPAVISVKPQRRMEVHSRHRTSLSLSRAFTCIGILLVLCGLIGTFQFFSNLPTQLEDTTRIAVLVHKQGSIVETKLGEPSPGSSSGTVIPSALTPNANNPTPDVQSTPIDTSTPIIESAPVLKSAPTPIVGPTITPTVNPIGVPVIPLTHKPFCVSGALAVDSSPNLQPVLEQVDIDFHNVCPTLTTSMSSDESRNSFNKLEHGKVDIIGSDLTASSARNYTDYPVGGMLYAIIINPDVGLNGLSTIEIQEIFEGRLTNWAQVGGSNLAISIVLPPARANINEIFHSFVSNNIVENADVIRINQDSPFLLAQSVFQTPGAISFVPLAVAQKSGTTILSVDGVAPSMQSLLDGTYQFWSIEHLYTKGRRSIAVQAYEGFLSDSQEEQVLSEYDVVPIHLINQQVINSHGLGPEV